MTASSARMGLVQLYRACSGSDLAGARARQVLDQHHWYASIAEFDPKTGSALPLALDEVLHRIARRSEAKERRDRLWRIVDHCRLPLKRVFAAINESPRREQAHLHIRDVRELNAASFIALSRRAGRNVREKLADKPYMQAVRRFQSVDLPENRLVKYFVTRLAELMELRRRHLGQEDSVLGDIYRWLRTDEAQHIGRWDSPPPNNTLLSHRDYRRIWDAYRWLQALDESIDRDWDDVESRGATIDLWNARGAAYTEGKTLFWQMPVLFDYETFEIKPWQEFVQQNGANRADVRRDPDVVEVAACVDLTRVRPRFAVDRQLAQQLKETYIWQRWERGGESVDLELFYADIPFLSSDATALSVPDLFFNKGKNQSLVEAAALAFARKLGATFTDPCLVWLVPDFLNDFQLQVMRRNINARFARAEPLPRSIAAVIEKVEYSTIPEAGFEVLVLDSAGGATWATKVTARYDAQLQKRVPDTRGFYWERSPHVMLQDAEGGYDPLTEIARIEHDGRHVRDTPLRSISMGSYSERSLRSNPLVGSFRRLITVQSGPVRGGARLHALQQLAGDIPVWRDHIPELAIRVHKGDRYQLLVLVGRGETIRPLRGTPVPVLVKDEFELPAGRQFYKFPLYQGRDKDEIGYVARLDSSEFPLCKATKCRLVMTFTYGADDPYDLVFEACDGSFRPVRVTWRPKDDEPVSDAPAPSYPARSTWSGLENELDTETMKDTNYLQWYARETRWHLDTLEAGAEPRQGRVVSGWLPDRNGQLYLDVEDGSGRIRVYQRPLVRRPIHRRIQPGELGLGRTVCFLPVRGGKGSWQARHVGWSKQDVIDECAAAMRGALYVPYIKIWGDARSLADAECPPDFRAEVRELSPRLERAWRQVSLPVQWKRVVRFLLCCMHRDMPEGVVGDLVAGASARDFDDRAYAFALGDLGADWQRSLLGAIVKRGDERALAVLAQAIWRTESFVRVFDGEQLAGVGALILATMRRIRARDRASQGEMKILIQCCELILGLLRSRDSERTEVRMALQPHQELTKNLAREVEATVKLVEGSPPGPHVKTRVVIADLPERAAENSVSRLFYAVRLYLSGDVGSDGIRVASVDDGESDGA